VCEFFADFDSWNTNGSEKPKTVAIVNLEITYGHEVSESVGQFLADNGFEVVYEEFFEPGVADWTATIPKLKSLNPDIVLAPQYFEDSVTFVQKCKELNYSAPYMIIEGMGWDPTSWTNPEAGGLDPSVAKSGFFSYSVYKSKYESDTKDYLASYVKEKYNSIPGNDILCGFMAVELACKAAIEAGSTEKADLIKVLTENTFHLAGYDYTMSESGGNAADFSWGVGQYIPDDLASADTSGDDWYVVYPEEYKDHEPVYPFPGWE
jgi:ABC-type branched-subunit amino acid transport system substrate-binding protein